MALRAAAATAARNICPTTATQAMLTNLQTLARALGGEVNRSQVLAPGPGESRGGISPPRAPKTVREPLNSHGFRCSASDIHEPPMSKEVWIGTANPSQPISRAFGSFAQALVLSARPAD